MDAYLTVRYCESAMPEIFFEVREDENDGGYVASSLELGIHTQGETLEELRAMVRDAVQCHFSDGNAGETPKIVRLHFVEASFPFGFLASDGQAVGDDEPNQN